MKRYRGRARRGVLLLVILGLLAMFGLVAVAFVVVSGHAMRSSKAIQRIGQQDDRPRETLHQGLLQALRGTNNPGSRMGPHSLLEDLYGPPSYVGQISVVNSPLAGGQLFEFSTNDAPNDPRRGGCVLTMLTGTAAGQSTHIVAVSATGRCQAVAFDAGMPQNGDRCVINGAPFSGTGFGYKPQTGKLDAKGTMGLLLALVPGAPENFAPAGGANEDYDAVDFQNMLMGAQIVDPATGQVFTIPSLHRPALVNYWMNQPGNWGNRLDLQRRVILRPLPQDHYIDLNSNNQWDSGEPDFTGKILNQGFNLVDGPWDVDNDGDSYLDSVWVDLGMPVRSTEDGRLYKPLFALLCLDMDGRLNLNAHGCPDQADPADANGNGTPDYYEDATLPNPYRFAGLPGGTPTATLPRGQGYGPAEINLAPLFRSSLLNPPNVQDTQRYQSLMVGNGTIGGRYGETPGAAGPGVSGFDDLLSQNVGYEFWNGSGYYPLGWSYWGFGAFGGSPAGYRANGYGTPPDLNANGFLGLDAAGRPLYWRFAEPNEQQDDPYEFDLSRQRARGLSGLAPIDNAFGVGELERLLRPFDRDATRLPGRLAALTFDGTLGRSILHDRRHAITTDSWDLPCPAVALPKHLRDLLPDNRGVHVTDLLRAKNVPEAVWKDLLPPEVLAGQRMNLNRPLGDGQDNNPQNGVVDEPGEALAMLDKFQQVNAAGNLLPPIDFDHVNGIDVNKDGSVNQLDRALARQLHARHLYVLLLLLADTEYLKKELKTDEEVVRFLAQWAVNAVDFRDRDSIMTRFHFDPDPFAGGGWNPPPADPRYVVFGCERPELLISETLAFHDRRTEDLEDPEKRTDHDPQDEADNDFDQKKRPRGAFFVELYNPWTSMEPPPGEFCFDRTANALTRGVRLNQTTATGGHPVWRLIVVEPEEDQDIAGEQVDPDDPMDDERPLIERSVYFVELPASFDDPKDGKEYWPDMWAEFAPVLPGRYAVVGPGEAGAAGPEYPTPIGDRSDGGPSTDARRIVLTPDPNPGPPGTSQVEVFENNNGANTDLPLNEIMPATAVVINRPRRLSISEPTDGYEDLGPGGQPYDQATGEYETAFDEPLDTDSDLADALLTTGTTTGVRVVHLQRLADPLMPWDPNINPYRTIDSMPVDLTAFNGVTSDDDPLDAGGDVMFDARQRGETEQTVAPGVNNLWKQEPVTKTVAAGTDTIQNHYFDDLLKHTLGFLNEPFGQRANSGTIYRGDPGIPFPWLTWNNRPYVSQLELMLVPVLRSSKLLVRNEQDENAYYRFVKKPLVDPKPYDAPNTPATNVAYPHLMNFFQSTESDTSGNSPQLHRLLEYVHVPSRFVGTQLQGNPAAFVGPNHWFRPPFNRISRYRDPGRVNLNTIFDERVFRGLMNDFPGMNTQAFWAQFVESRRGYAGANVLSSDSTWPTRFVRPFRSFAGGQMVPLPAMKPAREVDATLLRSDGLEPSDTTSQRPLFHHESLQAYNNTDRNPYFRYQGLQRLGNLVTTRSNVYVIWATVGYFEVEQVPYDSNRYPDGFKLLGELGIETGEVQRHRAFYIIDRSIPVGFRRGQDYNVEDGILVKRFIE